MLYGDAGEKPGLVLPADQQWRKPLGEREIMVSVPLAISLGPTMLGESLEPVLANGLEEMIPGRSVAGFHDHQRLVDECRNTVENVFRLEWVADANGLGSLREKLPAKTGGGREVLARVSRGARSSSPSCREASAGAVVLYDCRL